MKEEGESESERVGVDLIDDLNCVCEPLGIAINLMTEAEIAESYMLMALFTQMKKSLFELVRGIEREVGSIEIYRGGETGINALDPITAIICDPITAIIVKNERTNAD